MGDPFGVLEEHGEFVATEAGNRIPGSHGAQEALGYLDEEPVARGVSESVVHHLEVVDVDVEHGDFDATRTSNRQGVLEPVDESSPIGQAGERIVQGLVQSVVDRLLERFHCSSVGHGQPGVLGQ